MKKKIWFWILALLLIGGGVYYKFKKKGNNKPQYSSVQVQRGDLQVSILATGEVQPQNRLEIKAPIAGRIEAILVQEGQSVRKGQVLAQMSSTERAALLDAARAKGEDEYQHWLEVYKAIPLIAPMSGVIIARSMEPGQTLTSADIPLVMSDRLIVKGQVDETDIARVKVGQAAEITLDAYANKRIRAKVDHIAYEAKTVSNVTTYEVDVLPERVPDFMRSGMTANISFIIERKEDVLLLPQAAIKSGEGGTQVLVPSADPDKKAKPDAKSVEIGATDGKRVEVVQGVSEGDTVLVPEVNMSQPGASGGSPFSPMGQRRGAGGGGGNRSGASGGSGGGSGGGNRSR